MRIVSTPLASRIEWPQARPSLPLGDLREAFLCPAGTGPLVERLLHPEALVVTTGQQPGLLTGPLYTIYKALSAAALARHLESRWQRPVQPVFWIAGDDHDFAEANHTSWPATDGTASTAVLRDRDSDAHLTPAYQERLGPEITGVLERFAGEVSGTDRVEVLAWLARHYQPDTTLAVSFGAALAELLAPHGILCFDPTHPAARRATARHIVRALGLAGELDRDLAARRDAMMATGLDPGVVVGDGATLVMLEGRLGRDRLVRNQQGFVTRRSGERFSLDDLQRIAAENPGRLSGNVLLRPVLESAVLPTVAYLAGPGELRYLPLAEPVYDRMRVHRQLPVPRWSGLLVEPRVDRTLDRHGAQLDELLESGRALETRIVRSTMPEALTATLDEIRETIQRLYDRVEPLAVDIDPNLAQPVDRARRRALSERERLESRIVAHLRRREDTVVGQLARARTAVLPGGKPQERVYGIPAYLARYGNGVLDLLATAIAEWYAEALEAAPQPS